MNEIVRASGGLQSPPEAKGRKWLCFLFGVLLIWLFVFIVAPLIDRVPFVGQAHGTIKEEEIEAGAFWYVDVEKVAKAATFMRNVRDYAPAANELPDG